MMQLQDQPAPTLSPIITISPKRVAPPARVRKKDVPPEDRVHTTTAATRTANIIAVILPFAGLVTAICLLWGVAFDWVHLGIMLGMYVVTGLGITVGYHRFFTHKSFSAPRPIAFLLGMFGSMAVQGSIIEWAAVHRSHHQHSDDHNDPHSPNMHQGSGVFGVLGGLWHAHAGWMFKRKAPGMGRYVRDLNKDKMVRAVSTLFPVWVLIGLLVPAALGGLLTMTWMGALLGFLWGGLARVFLVHHVTWSVNSVCHIWGSRPFESHDYSRNNPIFGVLAMGEGWHNNHHAFPTSARHGLAWWQFDLSWVVIRTMGLMGLARNIRVPAVERQEAKRRG
jgi:stearoyl-CoA desaturase (delta-9 desaturase)